jgi:hypothetical protein
MRNAVLCSAVSAAMLCLAIAACRRDAPPPAPAKPVTVPATHNEDSGAVSSDGKPSKPLRVDALKGKDWPSMALVSGTARISCEDDDPPVAGASAADDGKSDVPRPLASTAKDTRGDAAASLSPVVEVAGAQRSASADPAPESAQAAPAEGAEAAEAPTDDATLRDLGFTSVAAAMTPCRDTGRVRVVYAGKISGDFTALVQRIAAMADRLGIAQRTLDIDSTGGRVEDAMPAGDAIAESHWTIRVREQAICHSACVLVLAAGDDRRIEGRIGIHRMMRVGSRAQTRAELSQELREVYGEMKDYLERNGASVAIGDLMMTVPNRSLRLLSEAELKEYGLSGENAVQDDLDRIRLARRCGEDFVKRRDAYEQEFDEQCAALTADADALASCTKPLRERYVSAGDTCPVDGGDRVAAAVAAGGEDRHRGTPRAAH